MALLLVNMTPQYFGTLLFTDSVEYVRSSESFQNIRLLAMSIQLHTKNSSPSSRSAWLHPGADSPVLLGESIKLQKVGKLLLNHRHLLSWMQDSNFTLLQKGQQSSCELKYLLFLNACHYCFCHFIASEHPLVEGRREK